MEIRAARLAGIMFTRRTRRLTASIVAAVLLIAQLAVAAYACPYVPAATNESTMPANCASAAMQAEQPNLCQAHADVQSLLKGDQSGVPFAVSMPVVTILLAPVSTVDSPNASRSDSYSLSRLAPDGSPPIYVSHQVFRK